jgi:adenosylmethionine-8-amino-7-oxononanoate aminotransferase
MNSTLTDTRVYVEGSAAGIPAELDAAHILHPQTRVDTLSPDRLIIVERARGVRMWDTYGNEWLDGVCGQVNVSFGYARPEISAAVREALDDLGFATMFHSQGHIRASRLAEKLAGLTPTGIEKFFFTTGGSDAVDTALKFARLAHSAIGRDEKNQIIGRLDSYHGMTFGGTTVTGRPGNWQGYGPLLPGVSHIDQPQPGDPNPAAALEKRILEIGPEKVAAFIAEPISMPNGMKVPPEDYWPAVRDICTKYGVLLIADEIVCGFGRTGEMFGMNHWGVSPDLMTMSKALNNGAIPMGAVGMTAEVAARIGAVGQPLSHGFTGGAHPAACAAALATLKLIEDDGLVEYARELGVYTRSEIDAMAARTGAIQGHTGLGMLIGIIVADPTGEEDPATRIPKVIAKLRELRLLARAYPAHGVIALAPSVTASKEDVSEMLSRIEEATTSDLPAAV